jgi:hypothetical protein
MYELFFCISFKVAETFMQFTDTVNLRELQYCQHSELLQSLGVMKRLLKGTEARVIIDE